MTDDIARLRDWEGGIDALIDTTSDLLARLEVERGELNLRQVRDYLARGLLGATERRGKELHFGYEHLMRLAAVRVLLADGWSLAKIAEFLRLSGIADIEGLLPSPKSDALAKLHRIQRESRIPGPDVFASSPPPMAAQRVARASALNLELRQAMRRLGLPEGSPPTEDLTLVAIAPWFQILIERDRVPNLTLEDAEELGRAVTASLTHLIARTGYRK